MTEDNYVMLQAVYMDSDREMLSGEVMEEEEEIIMEEEKEDFYDFLPFQKEFLMPMRDRAFSWDVKLEDGLHEMHEIHGDGLFPAIDSSQPTGLVIKAKRNQATPRIEIKTEQKTESSGPVTRKVRSGLPMKKRDFTGNENEIDTSSKSTGNNRSATPKTGSRSQGKSSKSSTPHKAEKGIAMSRSASHASVSGLDPTQPTASVLSTNIKPEAVSIDDHISAMFNDDKLVFEDAMEVLEPADAPKLTEDAPSTAPSSTAATTTDGNSSSVSTGLHSLSNSTQAGSSLPSSASSHSMTIPSIPGTTSGANVHFHNLTGMPSIRPMILESFSNISDYMNMHTAANAALHPLTFSSMHHPSSAALSTLHSIASMGADGVFRIGAYTKEERLIKIEMFRAKKRKRIWSKQIKYDCRKRLADTRPRVKGRFVSRKNDGSVIHDDDAGLDENLDENSADYKPDKGAAAGDGAAGMKSGISSQLNALSSSMQYQSPMMAPPMEEGASIATALLAGMPDLKLDYLLPTYSDIYGGDLLPMYTAAAPYSAAALTSQHKGPVPVNGGGVPGAAGSPVPIAPNLVAPTPANASAMHTAASTSSVTSPQIAKVVPSSQMLRPNIPFSPIHAQTPAAPPHISGSSDPPQHPAPSN